MFLHDAILALVLIVTQQSVQGDLAAAIAKDFNERVERYWDIHKQAEAAAPKIDKKKEEPAAILEHEKALTAAIRNARTNAREGDVFTPAIQKMFVAAINQDRSTERGKAARDTILGEGNPRHPESEAHVELVVNGKYPSNAPLSTVPPSVLLKLPKLPQGLEYRFVGRHLILFDSKANLIVDILRNAIK